MPTEYDVFDNEAAALFDLRSDTGAFTRSHDIFLALDKDHGIVKTLSDYADKLVEGRLINVAGSWTAIDRAVDMNIDPDPEYDSKVMNSIVRVVALLLIHSKPPLDYQSDPTERRTYTKVVTDSVKFHMSGVIQDQDTTNAVGPLVANAGFTYVFWNKLESPLPFGLHNPLVSGPLPLKPLHAAAKYIFRTAQAAEGLLALPTTKQAVAAIGSLGALAGVVVYNADAIAKTALGTAVIMQHGADGVEIADGRATLKAWDYAGIGKATNYKTWAAVGTRLGRGEVEFGQWISHVPVSIAQLVFAKMGTTLDYAGVGWDPIRDADGNFKTGIMSALQLSKGTYGDPTSEWYMPAGLFLAERGLIHLIVKVDDLLEAAVHVAQDHVKTFSSMNVDRFVWDALLPVLSTEPSAVFRFPGAGQPNLEAHLKSLALAKQRNGMYTPWSADQVLYLVVPVTAMFAAIPPSVSGIDRWKMTLGGSALGVLAASPMGGGVDVCLPEEAGYSCPARNLHNAAVDALYSVLAMSAIPKQAKGIVAMSVTYLQPGVKRPVWKSYCNHMCVAMDPKGGILTPERARELRLSGTTYWSKDPWTVADLPPDAQTLGAVDTAFKMITLGAGAAVMAQDPGNHQKSAAIAAASGVVWRFFDFTMTLPVQMETAQLLQMAAENVLQKIPVTLTISAGIYGVTQRNTWKMAQRRGDRKTYWKLVEHLAETAYAGVRTEVAEWAADMGGGGRQRRMSATPKDIKDAKIAKQLAELEQMKAQARVRKRLE